VSASATGGPIVTDDAAFLSVDGGRYTGVSLVHELRRPREVPFTRHDARWELLLARPNVDRLEYLLELRDRSGGVVRVPDAGNPLRAPGAFGEKSVIEFPGYAPPAWVSDTGSPEGRLDEVVLDSRALRTQITALVWSAAGTDPAEPLPLLIAHDGPELARYAALLRLCDHVVARNEIAPFRTALLPPPLDRDETYSASARYARALAEEWLPALRSEGRTVGLGVSLGAAALLHAHWRYPGLFGGLFLQSGSFFRPRLDAHEAHFGRFARLTRFVSSVVGGRASPERIPVTVTCGTGEENLDNNRILVTALRRQGWDVTFVEHPDAHNWTSWRDALHPHLVELLRRAA
jgi:enterochelin esterase-like enzyme